MVALHIAGLPVEEVLLAAVAAASPLIALVGWELSARIKRLKASDCSAFAADLFRRSMISGGVLAGA